MLVLSNAPYGVAQSPASSMIKLLQSGRIPPERQGNVLALICNGGDANDIGFVVEKLIAGGLTEEGRQKTLTGLTDAFRGRGVVPTGDTSGWVSLWAANRPLAERLQAVELAGLWKAVSLGGPLRDLALAEDTPDALRTAALQAWATAAPDQAKAELVKATTLGSPIRRAQATTALVGLDLRAAATAAADLLVKQTDPKVVQTVLPPFLVEQRGPGALASALAEHDTDMTPDVAKLAARTMLATGRNASELSDFFLLAAGVDPSKVWTQDEIKAIAKSAMEIGDPVRGEALYRRSDLNCVKCHAVAKAGGHIGPDLSAVGSTSPADYVAASILVPEQDVKELYRMLKVLTYDGKSMQGIIVERNADRVILRDADGHDLTLAVDDIEDEKEAGSLMPAGLTAFLTDQELYDLVRFISELGKPGPYAIRDTPSVQTWWVMTEVPDMLRGINTTGTALEHLEDEPGRWTTITGRVDGTLPLDEAAALAGDGPIYLMAKTDVSHAGKVGVRINDWSGLTVWFGGGELKPEATEGELRYVRRMSLFFRIDRDKRSANDLKVDLIRTASGAEFQLVNK